MESNQPTTSFSTRFTQPQRKVVEDAAKILGCSAAKLIREAAVVKAADVVNAHGLPSDRMRRLAELLVAQVRQPRIREAWQRGAGDDIEEVTIEFDLEDMKEDQRNSGYFNPDSVSTQRAALESEHFQRARAEPVALPNDDLNDIEIALKQMGSEFIRILLQQWNKPSRRTGDFDARVNTEQLLRDLDD